MAARRERSRSTISPHEADPESSYHSWKKRRPSLFRHNSLSDRPQTMSSSTQKVDISAIADDQDHLVPLAHTLYDSLATSSIITKSKALATYGSILFTCSITTKTSLGGPLTCTSSITLRWRYEHGLQSFQETFYIVADEQLQGHDAVLRGSISVKPAAVDGSQAIARANPILMGSHGHAGKDERKKREEDTKVKERSYKEEVARQTEQVRRQLDGGKGGAGGGGGVRR